MEMTPTQRLRAKIRHYARWNYEGKCVYPPDFLYQTPPIFTEEDLDACLSMTSRSTSGRESTTSRLNSMLARREHPSMVKWILNEAACIFAILLLIDRPETIRIYYERSQGDKRLPLSHEGTDFYQTQWSFLTPNLINITAHSTLQRSPSLPRQRILMRPEILLPISRRTVLDGDLDSSSCTYVASLVTNNPAGSTTSVRSSINHAEHLKL